MNANSKDKNTYVPVVAVQDESSHWYVIPSEKSERYRSLSNKLYETDFRDVDMINQFEEEFGGYRTGGDLNNVQLYIKQENNGTSG